jgi:hypothetical protein
MVGGGRMMARLVRIPGFVPVARSMVQQMRVIGRTQATVAGGRMITMLVHIPGQVPVATSMV